MKITGNVAGITFRNKDAVFTTMRPEGEVSFRHDPKNKFDANAIEIYYDGIMIGFVKGESLMQEFLKDHPQITTGVVEDYCYSTGSGKTLAFNNDHDGRLGSLKYYIVHENGDDVEMTEDNKYIFEGVEYDRLSNVIKHYECEPESPGLDKWKMQFASYEEYRKELSGLCHKGTAMHKAIEGYIALGQTDLCIPDGFYNFVKKYNVEFDPDQVEVFLFDRDTGIAGRCDAIAYVTEKGVRKRVVLDWKSSKKPTKKHKLQCSWYGKRACCEEAWVVAFGSTAKQGYSLGKVENKELERKAAAVDLIKAASDLING